MEKQNLIKEDCWYVDTDYCDHECMINGCWKYINLKYQFDNSGLPKNQYYPIRLIAPEEDRKAFMQLNEIKNNIDEFVDDGRNLYLCSKYTGNGKTSWAVKILQRYFSYRAKGNYEHPLGMYVSTTQLLLQLKDFNNPLSKTYKNRLVNDDLIIFDDVAVAGLSQYDYTQLYSIIDARIFAGKSCIFTANRGTLKELSDILGQRLASRIYNTSEILELKGKDMR